MATKPERPLDYERMACIGAPTRSVRCGAEHMEECLYCFARVRSDLVGHRFYGFHAACDEDLDDPEGD